MYSLLDAKVKPMQNYFPIDVTSGYVLPHQGSSADDRDASFEVRAGIACLGQGLQACQLKIPARKEMRQPFCDFMQKQNMEGVVPENLGQTSTLAALHKDCPCQATMTVGFSCQTLSALGDRK